VDKENRAKEKHKKTTTYEESRRPFHRDTLLRQRNWERRHKKEARWCEMITTYSQGLENTRRAGEGWWAHRAGAIAVATNRVYSTAQKRRG